jgi:hypothetical protein
MAVTSRDGAQASHSIETSFGEAKQEVSPAAVAACGLVQDGTRLYRFGRMGLSPVTDHQWWSLDVPTSKGFAGQHCLPRESVASADFILVGELRPETPFVAISVPGLGGYPGGGIEIVVPGAGVELAGCSALSPQDFRVGYGPYTGVKSLAERLDMEGYHEWAATFRSAVTASSTGTEIRMAIVWHVRRLRGDIPLSDEADELIDGLLWDLKGADGGMGHGRFGNRRALALAE